MAGPAARRATCRSRGSQNTQESRQGEPPQRQHLRTLMLLHPAASCSSSSSSPPLSSSSSSVGYSSMATGLGSGTSVFIATNIYDLSFEEAFCRCLEALSFGDVTTIDVFADNLTRQQRASRFRSDDHLRTSAEDGIYKRMDSECVQAIYRWNMTKIRGVG